MFETKNKKNFSKFLVLALLGVGILGSVVAIKVYAAPVNLTTTVSNAAPTITAGPSDGSSSSTTPTNVGLAVSFTVTATDANNDGYWFVVCKGDTTGVSSSGGAAPTCTGGSAAYWCRSASAVATGVQNSCSYTALQGDAETNSWRAYACDNNASASSCSAVNTGSGVTGSPFVVNHPPVAGTVYAGPSYGSNASVDPGNGTTGIVYFQAGVTDPDTSNTIDMFVCDDATTAFVASTGACTNGTVLCSVTGVTSGTNAQCNDTNLAPIPTASGTYTTHIYLRDSASTKLANAVTDKTYSVTNVAPVLSAGSDGGSSSTTPTNVGSDVAFTGTADDNNGDQYWLIACPSAASGATNTNGNAPTCVGATAYCVDDAHVARTTQGACNYTTLIGNPTSSDWELYVCDDNAGTSACSLTAYTTNSPFETNHAPSIGTIYTAASTPTGADTTIDPGNGTTGVVYFQSATVTDSDSDTVDMFVCDDATTAFDASGSGACTGGNILCSVTGVASGAAANCNNTNLAPVPTAHGTPQVHIYLRDNNNAAANHFANAVSNKNYTVTDVAPTQGTMTFTNTTPIVGATSLSPNAESSYNQAFKATLTDNNGYADITSTVGAIYLSGDATLNASGQCSTSTELNCYNAAANCTLTMASSTTTVADCGQAANLITTWYNIKPSSSWKARLSAVTDLGTTTFSSNEGSFTVNALNALGVNETDIDYGSLGVGGTSAYKTTTIKNVGNIITDALINGDLMCTNYPTCSASTIARAQQHWDETNSFTWGTGDYALIQTVTGTTEATGCTNRTIAVTSAHATPNTSAIYWKLQIPGTQATGSYTGKNYFTATPNDCTGTN